MKVLIIGAGPAGLTAGLVLAKNGIDTTIVEADTEYVGGISRTVNYKGYRFDIGGHRFFTKNREIQAMWEELLGSDFLKRSRKSRIHYDGKFYDYPIKPFNALRNLGIFRSSKAVLSYARYKLFPIKPEKNYADWMTNRFGKVLFETFFKTYTEKVWGIPVEQISQDWAIQRVKAFSLGNAVITAFFPSKQRNFKTLIDSFHYPRFGPGMMWEEAARRFSEQGGHLIMGTAIGSLTYDGSKWLAEVPNDRAFDYVISTMPLRSLINSLPAVPREIREAARNITYRDFITILLIIDTPYIFDDNWIYIHDPEVRVGRIQNFKNWSEDMVPDQSKTSLGMEYFFFEDDDLWSHSDEELLAVAKREAVQLGFCSERDILDGTVVRVKKAYPVYDTAYKEHVSTIRNYLAKYPTLYTIGRNGMHRWNNQDHSMATALIVAHHLMSGDTKLDPWNVNNDAEYHEELSEEKGRAVPNKVS